MIRVAELRKARGMSQTALARALDISTQAVGAWESGRNVPRTEMLPRLAEVFGCTIDELYTKEVTESA